MKTFVNLPEIFSSDPPIVYRAYWIWKSSFSISEFCFSWPSYPSKIANSKATTSGISARSIPCKISKKRRTTLSFGFYYVFLIIGVLRRTFTYLTPPFHQEFSMRILKLNVKRAPNMTMSIWGLALLFEFDLAPLKQLFFK